MQRMLFFWFSLHPLQGPAWRCLEPQLAPVPAGFGVACGALLQRAAAVSCALIGLPASVLSAAVPATRSLPEPGPVLPRQRPVLPELPTPEPAGRMGGQAAARRRRRPDGQLRSAGAASSFAATAVRAGTKAGLRWRAAAWCAAALRSPGTGARNGRRTAARAAWYGGCSGESKKDHSWDLHTFSTFDFFVWFVWFDYFKDLGISENCRLPASQEATGFVGQNRLCNIPLKFY